MASGNVRRVDDGRGRQPATRSDERAARRDATRPPRTGLGPARIARVEPLAGGEREPVEDDREDDDRDPGVERRADVDACTGPGSGSSPRPGAPMSPVITIIERPSMIVWLIARPIARRASGSWTLRRTWPPVEPSERAASTVVARDAADAERRDPDRRRHREDQGRDRRRRGADQEQQRDRGQVGERRHDLHHVEDRRQDRRHAGCSGRPGSRAAARSRGRSRPRRASCRASPCSRPTGRGRPSEANPSTASSARRPPPNTRPSAPASPITPGQPSDASRSSKTSIRAATPARIGSRTPSGSSRDRSRGRRSGSGTAARRRCGAASTGPGRAGTQQRRRARRASARERAATRRDRRRRSQRAGSVGESPARADRPDRRPSRARSAAGDRLEDRRPVDDADELPVVDDPDRLLGRGRGVERPSGSPRRTGRPGPSTGRRPSPARMTQRRVRTCDFGMSRTKSST